jgi:hypothetical protein
MQNKYIMIQERYMQKANLIKNAWERSSTSTSYSDRELEENRVSGINHMFESSSRNREKIAVDVIRRLTESNNSQIRRVAREMYRHYTTSDKRRRARVVNRIHNFLIELREGPSSFPLSTPLQISSTRYRELINLRKRGELREGSNDWNQLEEALLAKVCHCVQKQLRKDLTQALLSTNVGTVDAKYNPFAICTSAVYNKRGFTIPSPGIRQCKDKFEWYRDSDSTPESEVDSD